MVAQPNKLLVDAERKLTTLLLELRNTPEFERVRLYVERFAPGKKLSEYLRDDSVPVKERAMLAETLNEILLTRDYSRLPELPAGSNGSGAHKRTVVAPSVAKPEPVDTESPAPDELRAMIREEVRREMAGMFEMIAKALREKD